MDLKNSDIHLERPSAAAPGGARRQKLWASQRDRIHGNGSLPKCRKYA